MESLVGFILILISLSFRTLSLFAADEKCSKEKI